MSQQEEFLRIHEQIQHELQAAVEKSQAIAGQDPGSATVRGESEDGVVVVVTDGRGLLRKVDFGREIAQYTAAELREAVLGALAAAHREVRGQAQGQPAARDVFGDKSKIEAYKALAGINEGVV